MADARWERLLARVARKRARSRPPCHVLRSPVGSSLHPASSSSSTSSSGRCAPETARTHLCRCALLSGHARADSLRVHACVCICVRAQEGQERRKSAKIGSGPQTRYRNRRCCMNFVSTRLVVSHVCVLHGFMYRYAWNVRETFFARLPNVWLAAKYSLRAVAQIAAVS